ncbi:MAG: hypothetical protein OJF49_000813 [Ktedonobacterales bacterium]|jgi:GNAT superfamily N-acetyltransferase|nr:MAG: hypothetical protein OJF49_000813 [Ktedonobacterales bacterium]
MATITFREATVADTAALARLRWEMERERKGGDLSLEDYTHAYIAATKAEMERGAHQAWIAEAGGEAVACVLLVWWMLPPNFENLARKRGFVSSVYTQPAYRRQGIARRLMGLLVERARADGVLRLVLWASDMGRPLYLDMGFTPSRGLELDF